MAKKRICVVTKNPIEACAFKMLLEQKTNVRWADGSLPTQVAGYEIFCFDLSHPYFYASNIMTGTTFEQLIKDKDEDLGFFKDLITGKYDIYVL